MHFCDQIVFDNEQRVAQGKRRMCEFVHDPGDYDDPVACPNLAATTIGKPGSRLWVCADHYDCWRSSWD